MEFKVSPLSYSFDMFDYNHSKIAAGYQIVKVNGEDITFYATSGAFYDGTPYSETMYFVRIVDPVYDYWNGSIIVNSTAFKIEFPLGYEKFVKLYSDGAFSSSSSSATFSPKIVEGYKYYLKVMFYKTTSSITKQTLNLVGHEIRTATISYRWQNTVNSLNVRT